MFDLLSFGDTSIYSSAAMRAGHRSRNGVGNVRAHVAGRSTHRKLDTVLKATSGEVEGSSVTSRPDASATSQAVTQPEPGPPTTSPQHESKTRASSNALIGSPSFHFGGRCGGLGVPSVCHAVQQVAVLGHSSILFIWCP